MAISSKLQNLFDKLKFTYDDSTAKLTNTQNIQISISVENLKTYFTTVEDSDIDFILQNVEFNNLVKKNEELYEIIDTLKKQCISDQTCSDNYDKFLKELYALEIKIIVYLCKKVKDVTNNQLLTNFIESLTQKLEKLNAYYDEEFKKQTGGFEKYINSKYKKIKYKGKYKILLKEI